MPQLKHASLRDGCHPAAHGQSREYQQGLDASARSWLQIVPNMSLASTALEMRSMSSLLPYSLPDIDLQVEVALFPVVGSTSLSRNFDRSGTTTWIWLLTYHFIVDACHHGYKDQDDDAMQSRMRARRCHRPSGFSASPTATCRRREALPGSKIHSHCPSRVGSDFLASRNAEGSKGPPEVQVQLRQSATAYREDRTVGHFT